MITQLQKPTRTRSIADIARALSRLRHAANEEREHACALFGVQLAPINIAALEPEKRPAKPDADATSINQANPGPHRPHSAPPTFDPVPEETDFNVADFDVTQATPKRLGDQPAWDIPPEAGGSGQAELVLPETDAHERLFEDLPEAQEPRLVPLLDPRRSNNILREICSTAQRSSTVDITRLLSLAERGLPMPAKLPYKIVHRPAPRIAVAYDATDRMTTFVDDIDAVKEQIRRVTNAQIIDLPWEIIEDLTNDEPPGNRSRLPAGMHLLLLSDLGFGGWSRQREWRLPTPERLSRLADEIAQFNITLSALLPVPTAKWESNLPGRIGGLAWDRISTSAGARQAMVRSRRGQRAIGRAVLRSPGRLQEKRPKPVSDEADRIALTAVFCSRVTPRRLRALRTAMLPRSTPEGEAQAWHSPHFIRYPTQIALLDHKSLDAIRDRAISWTRLIGRLDRYMPVAFDLWPDLISTRDHSAARTPILRPKDWTRARCALMQALAEPWIAHTLFVLFPQWRPELQALLNGHGCIILEEVREYTAAFTPAHIMDPFEEDLLWDSYLDSLQEDIDASAARRVEHRLARLEHSLTNILHKDEYRDGLEWTRHRLPRQTAVVQRSSQAQRLAMLAREILGEDIGLLRPDTPDISGESDSNGGIKLNESRLEQQDLYVWSPRRDRWCLQLEYGPEERNFTGALPSRIRVPALEQITLELTGDGDHQLLDIGRAQIYEFSWEGSLTLRTFQGTTYPITIPRDSSGTDAAFWLRHARAARLAGDWTAATRWARRAAENTLRPAAIFHLAKAAAISEEHVDGALQRIDSVPHLAENVRPRILLWRSVLAALSRMALLEVDSKLQDALLVGQSALNLLANNKSVEGAAYRLRIGAAVVKCQLRRMELRGALPTIRSMLRDLRRLRPHYRLRMVRLASAEALSALVTASLERAKPRQAEKIVRESLALVRPGDEEIRIMVRLIQARYATFYEPATKAVALYDEALQSARRCGRFDLLLEDGLEFCRTLYNSGRHPRAADVVSEIVERALARRSLRRSAYAFSERAYQLRFQHGGIEMPDACAAVRTVPREERRLFYRALTTSDRWLREEARQRGAEHRELIQTQAEAARYGSMLFTELLALNEMFKLVEVDHEAGKQGKGPPPTPYEARFLYLAHATGDNLGSANAYATMAGIEYPRWNGEWRMAERTDPNRLYERAIALCRRIEVDGNVLKYSIDWAYDLVRAEETSRALEVIEAAIHFGADKNELDRAFGMTQATRGDLLRILGRTQEARELLTTIAAATEAQTSQPQMEARAHLARLAADEGDWATALEHLELIEHAISSPVFISYELPHTDNYSVLIGDLIDGQALERFEDRITRQQAEEDLPPQDGTTTGALARNYRLRGRREHEKANRRAVWQTFTSRAGYLMCRMMTNGGSAMPDPIFPFNDFYYWGKALTDSGSSQAIWFLQKALDHVEVTNGKISQRAREDVEKLLVTAQSFVAEMPMS